MHDRKRRIGRAAHPDPPPARPRPPQKPAPPDQPATGRDHRAAPRSPPVRTAGAPPRSRTRAPTRCPHPHNTRTPSAPARARAASSKLVLPIPACPSTNTNDPAPAATAANSTSRPNNDPVPPHCRKARARMADRVARTGAVRPDIRRCTGHLRFPSAPRHTRAAQTLRPILRCPPPLVNVFAPIAQRESMRRPGGQEPIACLQSGPCASGSAPCRRCAEHRWARRLKPRIDLPCSHRMSFAAPPAAGSAGARGRQAISSGAWRAIASKSRSVCSTESPARIATLAIRQSVSARTVSPAWRHAR